MKNQTLNLKKLSYCIFMLVFISIHVSVTSQNLVVEQDYERAGACLSPGDEACVTIIAHKLLALSFESNVDAEVNVAFKKMIGQNIEYTLHFSTDRAEYLDRTLSIYCQSFTKGVHIPLSLSPKESKLFYITVTECYKNYLEKGLLLFKQCSYADAKEEFRKAQEECSDAPPNDDVKNKIRVIDSILYLRKLAKEYFEMLDFKKAEKCFQSIHELNKDDNLAHRKMIDCRAENMNYCEKYIIAAKNFFDKKEYEKAVALYNKVIENGCKEEYIELANLYLGQANKKLGKGKGKDSSLKKSPPSTVFTFQWAYLKRFGFSIGGYPDKNVSAYFTFLFNTDKITEKKELLDGGISQSSQYDFDSALGITIRPVKNKYAPLWLTVGVGYSGLIHSISPEIGILAKIPFGKYSKTGLALRYTFQYRAAIQSETRKLVPATNHFVGLGFYF